MDCAGSTWHRMSDIDEIMDIYLGNKGIHLNPTDKYCVYLETKRSNQINYKKYC
jgi:hypothetical protein